MLKMVDYLQLEVITYVDRADEITTNRSIKALFVGLYCPFHTFLVQNCLALLQKT